MSYLTSGFAEVTIKWEAASGYRDAMFSWGFQIAAWDESFEGIEADVSTWWVALGNPSTSYVTEIVVHVGTVDPSAPLVYEHPVAIAGSGSGALAPPQVCQLVNKRTLLGGRKGRGRAFGPAPLEGSVSSTGQLDGGYRDNLQVAYETLVQGLAEQLGGTPDLGVLLHTEASPAPTDITTIQVQSTVGQQQRRLVRPS